jgi:hypothetical protein
MTPTAIAKSQKARKLNMKAAEESVTITQARPSLLILVTIRKMPSQEAHPRAVFAAIVDAACSLKGSAEALLKVLLRLIWILTMELVLVVVLLTLM